MTLPIIVYVLCAVTSLACAVLLLRGYGRTRVRLLLWSGICFLGFFVNNVLLVVDVSVVTNQDLSILRSLPLLAGISALLYGLIWETPA